YPRAPKWRGSCAGWRTAGSRKVSPTAHGSRKSSPQNCPSRPFIATKARFVQKVFVIRDGRENLSRKVGSVRDGTIRGCNRGASIGGAPGAPPDGIVSFLSRRPGFLARVFRGGMNNASYGD